MANRHLARSIVLQGLFEWDTAGTPESEAPAILARNVAEFGGDDVDQPFMDSLLSGVIAKKNDIDFVITKAAPDWPLDPRAPAAFQRPRTSRLVRTGCPGAGRHIHRERGPAWTSRRIGLARPVCDPSRREPARNLRSVARRHR